MSRKLVKQSSVMDDIREVTEAEESDHYRTMELLMDDRFKRRKTILTNEQVSRINNIDVLSQIYDIDFLRLWVNNWAEWRTSGDGGKGRNDIVKITQSRKDEYVEREHRFLDALRRR